MDKNSSFQKRTEHGLKALGCGLLMRVEALPAPPRCSRIRLRLPMMRRADGGRASAAIPGTGERAGAPAPLLAAAVLLAFVAFLAVPSQTQAQTTIGLVSNIGQTIYPDRRIVGSFLEFHYSEAQRFTTGDNADGYTLAEVVVRIHSHANSDDSPRVSIYTNSSGSPGTLLYTFTNPASFGSGEMTFTAPADATLEKETQYFVVIEETSDGLWYLNMTMKDEEDTARSGWSIADTHRWRNTNSGTWGPYDAALLINIKGFASTDETLSGLALEDRHGALIALTPATFNPNRSNYTAAVFNRTASAKLTATTTASAATVVIENDDDSSTPNEAELGLAVGSNTLRVTVTAEDDVTTKTYRVVTTRGSPSTCVAPDLAGRKQVWTGTLTIDVSSLLGVPVEYGLVTDSNRGNLSESDFDVGTNSYTIDRVTVGTGSITVVIAEEELQFSLTGALTAEEKAKLSLHVCNAAFAFSNANYINTATTDSDHTYSWTGTGFDWAPITTRMLYLSVPLSTDATLSGLALKNAADNSAINVNETFATGTKSYTADVLNAVTTITVKPRSDHNATFAYLNASDTVLTDANLNTTGFQAALAVGANTIKVKVTAEDGNTTDTYTVVVTRRTVTTTPAVPPEVTVPNDWSLIPTGLGAGDKFRLIFLSSTKTNATSYDIADYNTFIQGRAAAGHTDIQTYSSGFRAVGCTADSDARDNTGTTGGGVAIHWLNGNKVADNNGDFYDSNWDDEANDKNELGANGPDTDVSVNFPYTGCAHNGTEAFDGLISLALGAPAGNARVGRPNDSGSGRGPLSSSTLTTISNSNTRPMYGLSQIFEVAAAVNTPPTGAPAITGVPQVGKTLTASKGTIADADGTTMADNGDTGYAYSYQWVRVDGGTETSITSATASTYTLTATDLGKTIKVQASFKDDEDTAEGPLPSAATVAVVAAAGACPAGNDWCATMTVEYRDAVLGKGFIESTGTGMLSDTTIDRDVVFMVREIRIVEGANAAVIFGLNDYLPIGTVFDLGGTNFTADAAAEQSHTGRYSWSVPAGFDWIDGQEVTVSVELANFAATGAPTISGTAQAGETLTAAIGDIADTDGLPATFPDDYTFQWLRVDGGTETPITGATGSTYTPVAADVGKKIKVKVDFTDDESNLETLTSNAYPSSGTITAATLPELSFASANITVDETAGTATLTVELDPASTGTVTVDYTTSDETAQAGEDYTATSDTLTFAASEISKTITVPILNDADYDPTERFRVTLNNASGATLPTSPWANVNIANDDAVPTASIANVTAGEGAGTLTLTMALDRLSNRDIFYSTVTAGVSGTATVADDYVAFLQGGTGRFTVPAGAMSATFDITIVDDSLDEMDETIVIVWDKLANIDATPTRITVTGTITDNDTAGVTLSKSTLTVTEQDTTGDSYTVVLDSQPTANVVVTVAGHASTDVTPTPTTLTFTSTTWNTPQPVAVTAGNDANTVNETVPLTHSAASSDTNYSGITIGGVTVTVTDNDTGNNPPTGAPAITGVPQVGKTLTASKGTIADADGTTMADNSDTGYAYSYQWLRVDGGVETPITGATAVAYMLAAADEGKTIKVQASFKDDEDTAEGPLPSAATVAVVAAAGACPAGNDWCTTLTVEFWQQSPTVHYYGYIDTFGTGAIDDATIDYGGKTWTVKALSIKDEAGTRTVSVDLPILDGVLPRGSVFTLGGQEFTTDATSEDTSARDYDWPAPAGMAWIDGQEVTVSVELANFAATGAPTISGTAQAGETLTAAIGDIADTDGLPATFPADYTFQWLRVDGGTETPITGATGSTYTPVAADVGKKVKVTVSFTDGGGTGEARTSNAYPSSGTITAATLPELSFASANITVDETAGTATLTVELDPASTGTVTVDYTTSDESAQAGEDYTATSDTLTFAASETSKTITVPILNDADYDPTERFRVTLNNASGATLPTSPWANVNITNDDAVPTASIANVTVGEGAGTLTLTMALDRLSNMDIEYFTTATDVSGTATVTDDYVAFSSRDFTVPAGAMSATLDITIVDDSLDETDETIVIVWQKGSGSDATPASITFTGTITDNDPNTPATGKPRISGTAEVGRTLTADTSGISDPDGNTKAENGDAGFAYTYQWYRVDAGAETPITGARTYTLVQADEGKTFRVAVSFTDDAGNREGPLTSNEYPAGAENGELRLEGGNTADEGRLEVFHKGEWGTVCDDRLDNADNIAPQQACRFMGYTTGEWVPRGSIANMSVAPTTQPIWLDDVRCFAGSNHWTGETPTKLHHCYHAGWGLNNCVHEEDVHLSCTGVLQQTEAEPLTATLEDFPVNHDGSSAFTFRIAFSAEVVISRQDMKEHALTVTGATVTNARRVDRRKDLWELTVEPAGTGAVSVLVPLGRACTEPGALCTADGQALTTGLGHSVPGPAPQGQQALAPLAAGFVSVPGEHDGETEFWLELSFGAAVEQGSKQRIRALLGVSGGSVTRLRRKDDRLDHWRVRVLPSSHEAVTVTLSPSPPCGATGAVCTPDGRTFTSGLATQIQGPPGLTVADAQVREAANAVLAFAVTLSRAPSGTVTVGYATSDGTATAGSDYTAASGTLTFAAGETEKTVSVAVLDDAHDEGSETLTLTLSNPSGAYLEDGTATGTINNSDHMPGAWMVRFGRTVGSQVVDALTQRLEGASGSHVTVGGIPLTGAPGAVPEAPSDDPFGLPDWATRAQREAPAQSLTANDLLLGSAFHLSSGGGQGAGAAYTAWGRVATSGFAAEVDGVTMDADVTSGLVGFDAEWERVLAGVMFSHSTGEGDYRPSAESGAEAGRVESSLTGVYPYARVALNARVSAWALAGAASGELTLKQEGDAPMPAGIAMRMGAAGFKGRVLDGTGASGLALDVKTDALWVGTKSERTGEMVATQGDVTRLRVTLAGERAFAAGEGARLTPSAEVGVRHDGGDAESGTGLEVGAGLRYVAGALTVEGQVRTLVAHEDSGYEEWGVSGTVRITPSASGRGLMLRFAPQWGRTASAVQRLWSARDASALGAAGEFEGGDARLVFDAGYGVGLGHGRGVLTPYAGLVLGDAGSRTVRTGARWQVGADAVLGLEGTRRTSGTGEAGNQLMLRVALRF